MDVSDLAPHLAALIGVQPSTLVLLILIVSTAANTISKLISSTATGWLGTVRAICAFIGVHVANRVAPGTTVTDVAKAALLTSAVKQNVDLVASGSADKAAESVRSSIPVESRPFR